MNLDAWLTGLVVMLAAAGLTWIVSVIQRNVTIVDSLWSLLFVIAAFTYARVIGLPGPRVTLLLVLVTVWGVRLAAYLSWRNLGHEEDRRYAAIRRRREPNFALKRNRRRGSAHPPALAAGSPRPCARNRPRESPCGVPGIASADRSCPSSYQASLSDV